MIEEDCHFDTAKRGPHAPDAVDVLHAGMETSAKEGAQGVHRQAVASVASAVSRRDSEIIREKRSITLNLCRSCFRTLGMKRVSQERKNYIEHLTGGSSRHC